MKGQEILFQQQRKVTFEFSEIPVKRLRKMHKETERIFYSVALKLFKDPLNGRHRHLLVLLLRNISPF
jgi:hypothetical protein